MNCQRKITNMIIVGLMFAGLIAIVGLGCLNAARQINTHQAITAPN
jgi:hypothetical protein